MRSGQPRVKSQENMLVFYTRNFDELRLVANIDDDGIHLINNDANLTDFAKLSDSINWKDFSFILVNNNKIFGSFRSEPDKLIVFYF
jgi:hypothetical protein